MGKIGGGNTFLQFDRGNIFRFCQIDAPSDGIVYSSVMDRRRHVRPLVKDLESNASRLGVFYELILPLSRGACDRQWNIWGVVNK